MYKEIFFIAKMIGLGTIVVLAAQNYFGVHSLLKEFNKYRGDEGTSSDYQNPERLSITSLENRFASFENRLNVLLPLVIILLLLVSVEIALRFSFR